MRFLDRQQLLQVLYDNLTDKSKIHTSTEVFKLKDIDGGVVVATKDGPIFRGDIVVGADGVHSRTQQEIWRIADSETPKYNSKKLAECMYCTSILGKYILTERCSHQMQLQMHVRHLQTTRGHPRRHGLENLLSQSLVSLPGRSRREILLLCLLQES